MVAIENVIDAMGLLVMAGVMGLIALAVIIYARVTKGNL